jgi:hypothetical protein
VKGIPVSAVVVIVVVFVIVARKELVVEHYDSIIVVVVTPTPFVAFLCPCVLHTACAVSSSFFGS